MLMVQKDKELDMAVATAASLRSQVRLLQEMLYESSEVSASPAVEDHIVKKQRLDVVKSEFVPMFCLAETIHSDQQIGMVKVYKVANVDNARKFGILSNDLRNAIDVNYKPNSPLTTIEIDWFLFRKWSKMELGETIHNKVSKIYLVDRNLANLVESRNPQLAAKIWKYID